MPVPFASRGQAPVSGTVRRISACRRGSSSLCVLPTPQVTLHGCELECKRECQDKSVNNTLYPQVQVTLQGCELVGNSRAALLHSDYPPGDGVFLHISVLYLLQSYIPSPVIDLSCFHRQLLHLFIFCIDFPEKICVQLSVFCVL